MNKIHFNPKRDIPYLAATIQAVIFAYSGSLLLGPIGWLIGGLLGVLVSVSVLYASSQYAATAKERKPWLIAGIAILMLFSPVINGTAIYLELPKTVGDIWRGVVAVAFGVLPDVAAALAGFTAGKGMVRADEAQPEAKPKPKKPAFICSHPLCGFEAASQAALNGHKLKHKPKKAKFDVDKVLEPFERAARAPGKDEQR